MAANITKKNGRRGVRAKFVPRAARRVKAKAAPRFLALEDDLLAIGMAVPAGERAKLPRDFNENLDHYLYGAPRKKPRRG